MEFDFNLGKAFNDIGSGFQSATRTLGSWVDTLIDPFTHRAENIERQKEQQQYDRALQERIFQREDTAFSRAAADLANAGLSKTLAAGNGASSGAVVNQKIPQNEDNLMMFAQMANQMAQISHTRAETARLENDTKIAQEFGVPMSALSNDLFVSWVIANKLLEGQYNDTPVGNVVIDAAKGFVDAAKTVGGYVNPRRNVSSGVPIPRVFNDYNSYLHACQLADTDPVSWSDWDKARNGDANTYNAFGKRYASAYGSLYDPNWIPRGGSLRGRRMVTK